MWTSDFFCSFALLIADYGSFIWPAYILKTWTVLWKGKEVLQALVQWDGLDAKENIWEDVSQL